MSSPLFPPSRPVDLGFLEARSKLLDIAAFLDRVERAGETQDYRVQAFLNALQELGSADPTRTRRILESLSDHSSIPLDEATTKSASGAPVPPT
jgi:hypothetical protein